MEKSRSRILAIGTLLALLLAACGGNGQDAPGGNGTDDPGGEEVEIVDSIVIDQDSEPATYFVRGGRYRVAWRHTDCPEGIDIVFNKVGELADAGPEDQRPYEYGRTQRVPQFNTLLQNVPGGEYDFGQTNEECATWQLRADRVGG